MTPEPLTPEEIEVARRFGSDGHYRYTDDRWLATIDAANPAPAGLDVERLAAAIAEAYVGDYEAEWFDDASQPIPHVMAPQIAAEYARLERKG